jgi:serine/threonine-protein kinase
VKSSTFKSDWFAGLLITLVFLIFADSDFVASLERDAYDFGVKSSSRSASNKIAIIAIDDQSIENIGRWPWPRNTHAKLLDILKQANAKAVGQTIFFSEPQLDPGLQFIRELKQSFETSSISAVPSYIDELTTTIESSLTSLTKKQDTKARSAVNKIALALKKSPLNLQVRQDIKTYLQHIDSAEIILDTDKVFAQSIHNASNTIFHMPAVQGTPYGEPDESLPAYVTRNKIPDKNIIGNTTDSSNELAPITLINAFPPIAVLGEHTEAIGASVTLLDVDGSIRNEPLVVDYYGDIYPSMALILAAKSLNLTKDDIQITFGSHVKLGRLNIKTDGQSLMHTFFYHDKEYDHAFPVDSFYDVLQGNIPASKYKDKIVLIGATALGVGDTFVTPINPAMPPVVALAHSISSILNEDFFISPNWATYARFAAILLVALYLMFLFPKLSAVIGFTITSLLLLSLFAIHYFMMTTQSTWLPLMAPALLLVVGHILLTTKRFFLSEKGKARLDIESAETNRMLGLSQQGQGQLDMAFEKFRKLPADKSSLELLYNLALDYERKRQFNKAKSVYDYMSDHDADFRDIAKRSNRAQSLEENVILGGASLQADGSIEQSMLGRYQLEDELGKGAMGVVYLGKDPKISRTVAIKTMALSQEFEESELAEVKLRFFREAETAGRLTHSNIVTIYDAGEEHDLAYIAMEFLKGGDLTNHIKPDSLLPIKQTLSLIQRAASALDYAHRNNVVHRDIKPANLMWDPETDTLKITDFGIARITDSSKTKTGLVLGTPSYMSPE